MVTLPVPGVAEQFMLRRDVTFLNHGSFGACPRPVFDAYQRWQRELEAQPVEFIGRRLRERLATARAALGGMLGVAADDVVFVPNVTYALNVAARSITLQPGDEVLTSDHEYGAIDRTWQYTLERSGARLVVQPLSLPFRDAATIV